MRVWAVLVLLAGCSAAPPEQPPGPEAPLAGRADAGLQLLGPPGNGTLAVDVVAGRCHHRDNVMAYNITASSSTLRLHSPLPLPNATSFAIAAFTGDDLAPHFLLQGGSGLRMVSYHDGDLPQWTRDMPRNITIAVPEGQDHLLLVIACRGDGTMNFVVDSREDPRAPRYLKPVVATGFDNILARVSDDILGPHGWSMMGQVRTQHDNAAPQGVRVGETVISWEADAPGWTQVACSHYGISDHGIWKYDASLHGHEAHEQGFVQYELATLSLTQYLLFGDVVFTHAAEGDAPAAFRFEVEHDVSLQWSQTDCRGLHLGATLMELFGRPALTGLNAPDRYVQPSDIGGWPLDD